MVGPGRLGHRQAGEGPAPRPRLGHLAAAGRAATGPPETGRRLPDPHRRRFPPARLLSPALARTDSEKQALALLFESWWPAGTDSARGSVFEPLAAGRPLVVPLGREFKLPGIRSGPPAPNWRPRTSSARSASGRRAGGLGVGQFNREGGGRRRRPVPGDAAAHARVYRPAGGDELLPSCRIPSGRWTTTPSPSTRSAAGPFSSPRAWWPRWPPFAAKPGYGGRGVPRPSAESVSSRASCRPSTSTRTGCRWSSTCRRRRRPSCPESVKILKGRRVYFLAVNHRRQELQSPALRKALAHVIDRQKILNERFRGDMEKLHQPLNGPYPARSWACDPRERLQPPRRRPGPQPRQGAPGRRPAGPDAQVPRRRRPSSKPARTSARPGRGCGPPLRLEAQSARPTSCTRRWCRPTPSTWPT